MVACGSGHTATFGMTKFADWTDAEFRARLLSGLDGRPSLSKRTPSDAGVGGGASTTSGLCKFSGAKGIPRFPYNCTYVQDASFVNSSVPKEWDWRDVDGVITPVKNQGACGGWNGLLSVQQILDCDPASASCCGGLPERALTYANEPTNLTADTSS
eukprot:gene3179-28386_t